MRSYVSSGRVAPYLGGKLTMSCKLYLSVSSSRLKDALSGLKLETRCQWWYLAVRLDKKAL